MTQTIKALTLTQPWATLVAIGSKRIETRSWAPHHAMIGRRIAIHAAKHWSEDDRWLATTEPFKSALRAGYRRGLVERPHILELPRGCVVALATLEAVYPTTARARGRQALEELLADARYPHEAAFGNYGSGRYALALGDVRAVEPIVARGALGFWDWQPPDWLTYLDPDARLAARAAAAVPAAVEEQS